MKTIKEIAHEKYLTALNLYRFMCGSAFSTAWESASATEKECFVNLINNCTINLDKAENWTKEVLKRNNLLDLLDLNYLKEMAKELGISNYYQFSKPILIGKIYDKQQKQKQQEANNQKTDTEGIK